MAFDGFDTINSMKGFLAQVLPNQSCYRYIANAPNSAAGYFFAVTSRGRDGAQNSSRLSQK